MFWEILLFQSYSTAKLLLLAILKKIDFFLRKTHTLFKKNPSFERFEKSYYFSRILRQFCYNLIKKLQTTDVGSFTQAQLANIG